MSNNEQVPPVKKGADKDRKTAEEVKVPRSLLEQMMNEIQDLKTQVSEQAKNTKEDKKEEKPVDESTVVMRFYEGDIVVGFDKKRGTYKKFNKDSREDRLMMDIVVNNKKTGEDRTLQIDYLKFMEDTPVEKVSLIKVTYKPVVKELGYISVKEVIEYKTVNTPNKVMQKVISSADTATIRMPNGSERKLDIDFVNM